MSAQYLTKRARTFIRDGKFQEAVDKLNTALEQDPEYTAAYNLLGIAQSRLGNEKKALATFRKGKNLDKENPVLHFNLAIALETTGQPDKAVPRYRAAFRIHPGWLDAMNALGLALIKQEDYPGAKRSFSTVLKYDPANVEALNNQGLIFSYQGRHKEAIKKYHAALEIDPTYVNAGLNLSRALEDTENFVAALEELERLVDLLPEDWEVRTRLAALYERLLRHDEAMDQAQVILEGDPDNIRALRIEGAILGLRGNDEEAKNIFERIMELGPDGENDDGDRRFMIETPKSRYWPDLVPPPAALLPDPPAPEAVPVKKAQKPVSTHPGAVALAKARAAKKAAQAAPAVKARKPAAPVEVEEVPRVVEAPEPTPAVEVPPEITVNAEELKSIREELKSIREELKFRREKFTVNAEETPEPAAPVEEAPEPASPGIILEADPVEEALEPASPETAYGEEFTIRGEGRLLSLMRYMMNLTKALPEPVLDEFVHSDERIEMKYIIYTLEHANE